MHDRLSLAANRRRLAAALVAHLRSAGAADTPGAWHKFSLETAAGTLTLTVDIGFCSVTVFARFADPARAIIHFAGRHAHNCINRYDGTWNHHYWDFDTLSAALNDFQADLTTLAGPLPGAKKIQPPPRQRKTCEDLFDCHPE